MRIHVLGLTAAGATLLVLANVSNALLAQTADAAHDAAVLDRIFANWKSRQDRVHSFHYVWNCRTTFKKGTPNPFDNSKVPLKQDFVLEQSGVEYWMDGDDRRCLITPVAYKLPRRDASKDKQLAERWVLAGDKSLWFFASPPHDVSHRVARSFHPYGLLQLHAAFERVEPNDILRPLMLLYRPRDPLDPWLKSQCRLLDQKTRLEEGLGIKFQRVVKPTATSPTQENEYWVSPARGDVIVRWSVRDSDRSSLVGSIKYKRDKSFGWVPTEWNCETADNISECQVTEYALNEKIDPRIFALEFRVGTAVCERLDPDSSKTRQYLIEKDGFRRTITYDEFAQAAGWIEPPKKPPAKQP